MKITSLKELRSLETGGYKFSGTFSEDDLTDFVSLKKSLQEGKEPIMYVDESGQETMFNEQDILDQIDAAVERIRKCNIQIRQTYPKSVTVTAPECEGCPKKDEFIEKATKGIEEVAE